MHDDDAITIAASNDAAPRRRCENNTAMIATTPPAILSMTFRSLLCLSTLRIDATAVGALFRETRVAGEQTGIQGAVVSDGERVAHVMHGVPERVSAMLTRILSDVRLADAHATTIQDVAHDDGRWPLSGWKAGWATPELLDAIVAESARGPNMTLTPFVLLLKQCDLL